MEEDEEWEEKLLVNICRIPLQQCDLFGLNSNG